MAEFSFQKVKLSRKLSDLVVYTQSRHLKKTATNDEFQDARKNSDFHHISSIKESDCFKYCTERGRDFSGHTAFQLVRIYPAGKRVDSSNYNPLVPWSCGCQIGKNFEHNKNYFKVEVSIHSFILDWVLFPINFFC